MTERFEIVYKPVFSIKPYEKNPRRNDDAVQAVKASIEKFGFKVPIVIDNHGVIVAGHTRYKAAVELGLTEVPTISADHLSPAKIKAFRLADNKVGEIAEWDMGLLEIEMKDMASLFDMESFGFMQKKPKDDTENDDSSGTGEEDSDIITCPKCKRPFSRKEGRHV